MFICCSMGSGGPPVLTKGGGSIILLRHEGCLTPAQVPEAKKTVDNYQVKFPGSQASTAQHVGVTELIFA